MCIQDGRASVNRVFKQAISYTSEVVRGSLWCPLEADRTPCETQETRSDVVFLSVRGDLNSEHARPGTSGSTLRHRFAMRAYMSERDLRAVQELLGHAKPETTARYAAVPDGALLAAVMGVGSEAWG
jgi:integrase